VATAPKEQWQPLIKAADKRGWSRDATRLAVRNLKDDRIPDERKREILKGDADPLVITENGEFAVPASVVGGRIAEMAANDAILIFQRALEHLGKARLFKTEAIFGAATADMLEYWSKELPGDIAFLQEVLSGTKDTRTLRVVKQREG
jgi:hypothetical protein